MLKTINTVFKTLLAIAFGVSLFFNYSAYTHQYGVFKISAIEARERALDVAWQSNAETLVYAMGEASKESKSAFDVLDKKRKEK